MGKITTYPADVAYCPVCRATRNFDAVRAPSASNPLRVCEEGHASRRGGFFVVPAGEENDHPNQFDLE